MSDLVYRIILPYVEIGYENKPWMHLRVEALDGDDIIGYLKIAWIDYELGKTVFPTVWHYMSAMTGWCINTSDSVKLWRGAHYYAGKWPASRPRRSDDGFVVSLNDDTPTSEQLDNDLRILAHTKLRADDGYLTPIQQLVRCLTERYNWAYVDYPRVSFDYQRQGIATKMYILGAAWLGINRQTCLHSSSLQSKDAIALWVSLETSDLPIYRISNPRHPEQDYRYRCLDYSQNIKLRLQAKKLLRDASQILGTSKFAFKQTEPPFVFF